MLGAFKVLNKPILVKYHMGIYKKQFIAPILENFLLLSVQL